MPQESEQDTKSYPVTRPEVVLFCVVLVACVGLLVSEINARNRLGALQSFGAIMIFCGLAAGRLKFIWPTALLLVGGSLIEIVWFFLAYVV